MTMLSGILLVHVSYFGLKSKPEKKSEESIFKLDLWLGEIVKEV